MERGKGEGLKRMRVVSYLPEDLWEKVQYAAIDERRPVAHIIKDLLTEWVEKREGQKRGRR